MQEAADAAQQMVSLWRQLQTVEEQLLAAQQAQAGGITDRQWQMAEGTQRAADAEEQSTAATGSMGGGAPAGSD